MNSLLINNISTLCSPRLRKADFSAGNEMKDLLEIQNAFVLVEDGIIREMGKMSDAPSRADKIIDSKGGLVFPGYCDSHTHIVYPSSREKEFVDRINGLSYEEIARRGGGILNTAAKLAIAPEEELFQSALKRVHSMIRLGTTAIEIKSGYGLSLEAELKMLRVIRKLKETVPISIKSTFLGAHAVPAKYKENPDAYVDEIVQKMLPVISGEGLADYVDVFCDRGFFSPEQTDRILQAATTYNIKAKIHANELDYSGGIQIGVKNKALSVDHLEFTGPEEIEALLNSRTMPTLLPSTAFFLGLHPPPARKMLESGLPLALASDYNPGSSPSGDLNFIFSLACVMLKMLPSEALTALTQNAAYAMDLASTHGILTEGRPANICITEPMTSLSYMPYAFTEPRISRVLISGKEI